MFCEKCGNQLRDIAKFCQKCGAPVRKLNYNPSKTEGMAGDDSSQTPPVIRTTVREVLYQPQPRLYYPPDTHPYHSLGGFLMFIVVMNYIGGVIGMLSTITTGYAYISVAKIFFEAEKYMHGSSAFWFFSFLGSLILMLFSTTVMFSFASKIRNKDDGFLGYIQTRSVALLITSGCFYLTEFIWIKSYTAASTHNFSKSMWQILMWAGVWIASLIFCSAYFGSSVRVRTYMGNDAYLRNSMLNKMTVSPIPADGSDQFPDITYQNDSDSNSEEHKWRCSGCGNMVSSDPCPHCGKRFDTAWTCPQCGETNSSILIHCVSCGTPRKSNSKKPNTGDWLCPTCKRMNPRYVTTCLCGTPKENGKSYSPDRNEPVTEDEWVCPACGKVNANYVGTCGCGQPKF